MKIPEEKELLALLDKTEEAADLELTQIDGLLLWQNHKCRKCGSEVLCLESMEQLAQRMWEKAVKESFGELKRAMDNVAITVNRRLAYYPEDCNGFWIYEAKPIHRIIVSLIALRRAGETEL